MEEHSLVKEYAVIDKLAASILEDKNQIVDLDQRKNKTREALRQLKTARVDHKGGSKTWICLGNTFLKMDSNNCGTMLKKDMETIDAETSRLRDGLKPKVAQLHKMEGIAEVKGFELKGMRIEEILNISDPDTRR